MVFEVVCQSYDFVVVDVLYDDCVDFDWIQIDCCSLINVFEYFGDWVVEVVEFVENFLMQGFDVDCDVIEVGVFECLCFLFQQ